MIESPLHTALLDIATRLAESDIRLVIGGGYGLYLKQCELLSKQTTETLFPVEAWPAPRATADLDLFFPMKVLVELEDMQQVRQVLDDLNFEAVKGSEYWQFSRKTETDDVVKVDLMTEPIENDLREKLKIDRGDERRVRPKGQLKLHARPAPEAVRLAEHSTELEISGKTSDGSTANAVVIIPGTFTYLMMKVTAFDDQLENNDKQFGRHHALDVYRAIGMMNEKEYEEAKEDSQACRALPQFVRAQGVVKVHFQSQTGLGAIRIREHSLYHDRMQLADLVDILGELYLL
jgi:hypothetical protein